MNAGPGGGGGPIRARRAAALLRQRFAPQGGPAVHWGGGMKHSLGQVINYERAHGNKNIHAFLAQHPGLVQAFAKQRAAGFAPAGPQGYHPQEGNPVVGGSSVAGSQVAQPPQAPPGAGPDMPPPGYNNNPTEPYPGPGPSGLPMGILSGVGGSSQPSQSNDVYEMQKKMALLGGGGIGQGFLGGPASAATAGQFDPRQLAIQKAMAAFLAKRGAY